MPQSQLQDQCAANESAAPAELVRDTLSALQSQRSGLVAFVEQLLDEMEHLSRSLEEKERDITTQQKQLRDRELQITEQREENQEIQQAVLTQQAQLDSLLAEVGVLRTELSASYQRAASSDDSELQLQIDSLAQQRDALQEQLNLANEELRQTRTEVESKNEESHQVIALENELELVRHRAAELTEQLADQKEEQHQQQIHWGEEMRQMRQLLTQAISSGAMSPEYEIVAEATSDPSCDDVGKSSTGGDDVVVDSIMEQFNKLQQDVARRRKRHKA